MYRSLFNHLLIRLSPETSAGLLKGCLKLASHIPGAQFLLRRRFAINHPCLHRNLFGIDFRNPIGISAGIDVNAEIYNDLATLGLGFVEIGTITEKPQEGTPRPRCFWLPADHSIVNRAGHANNGIRAVLRNLQAAPPRGIRVLGNLSRGFDSNPERSIEDFDHLYTLCYDFMDAVVINCYGLQINTLQEVVDRITSIRRFNDEYRPILIKLRPDCTTEEADAICELILSYGLDGIIVNGSTMSHKGLQTDKGQLEKIGNGELSGAVIFDRTLEMLRHVHESTKGLIPIIASGGIMTPEQAVETLDAGASLIELHTGFIYNGPRLVRNTLKLLVKADRQRNAERNAKKKNNH